MAKLGKTLKYLDIATKIIQFMTIALTAVIVVKAVKTGRKKSNIIKL